MFGLDFFFLASLLNNIWTLQIKISKKVIKMVKTHGFSVLKKNNIDQKHLVNQNVFKTSPKHALRVASTIGP